MRDIVDKRPWAVPTDGRRRDHSSNRLVTRLDLRVNLTTRVDTRATPRILPVETLAQTGHNRKSTQAKRIPKIDRCPSLTRVQMRNHRLCRHRVAPDGRLILPKPQSRGGHTCREDRLRSGRFVSNRAVWTDGIEVPSPLLDQDLCFSQVVKSSTLSSSSLSLPLKLSL